MPSVKGDYLLIISGYPRMNPYLAGWQEFKDDVRRLVKDQPGWVDARDGVNQGETQISARLQRLEDVESAWRAYSSAKSILVHAFQTSQTSPRFRMLHCNCGELFPDVPKNVHSPGRSGVDSSNINELLGRPSASFDSQNMMPTEPMYPYAYPQTHHFSAMSAGSTQWQSPQTSLYSTSTTGMPVNVGGGAMLTEARGIFISNLNYSVGPTELNALLTTVGRPVESKLHRDLRTGLFKGVATAKFASKEEAMYAVTHLNRKEHMGMTLNVRMDTDTTVVGQVGPVIADSNAYKY